jgi:Bacterial regulatory proteins, luxR family
VAQEGPGAAGSVALGLSVKTAETHRSNIMRKLELHSISALVLYAVQNNIVHVARAASWD